MNESASELKRLAGLWLNLTVKTWSPGDGKTRYKFFPIPTNGESVDYYSSGFVAFATGLKEAWQILSGMNTGYKLATAELKKAEGPDNFVSRERFENLLEEKEGLDESYRRLLQEHAESSIRFDFYCERCGTSHIINQDS